MGPQTSLHRKLCRDWGKGEEAGIKPLLALFHLKAWPVGMEDEDKEEHTLPMTVVEEVTDQT